MSAKSLLVSINHTAGVAQAGTGSGSQLPLLPVTLLFVAVVVGFVTEYWPWLLVFGIFLCVATAIVASERRKARRRMSSMRQRKKENPRKSRQPSSRGGDQHFVLPTARSSGITTPWHSVTSSVHHNNVHCGQGNRIHPQRVRYGTGGRRLCKYCYALSRT